MADSNTQNLTNYTTPLDADVIPIDDVANNITKKIAYSKLKEDFLSKFSSGLFTKAFATGATSTVTIAHGLGKIPTKVKIYGVWLDDNSGNRPTESHGVYTNGNTNCIYEQKYNGAPYQSIETTTTYIIYSHHGYDHYMYATITVDATNIYLAFTNAGDLDSFSWDYLWEAEY